MVAKRIMTGVCAAVFLAGTASFASMAGAVEADGEAARVVSEDPSVPDEGSDPVLDPETGEDPVTPAVPTDGGEDSSVDPGAGVDDSGTPETPDSGEVADPVVDPAAPSPAPVPVGKPAQKVDAAESGSSEIIPASYGSSDSLAVTGSSAAVMFPTALAVIGAGAGAVYGAHRIAKGA